MSYVAWLDEICISPYLLASQLKRFGSLPGGEDGRNLEESVVAVENGKEIHVVVYFVVCWV